MCGGRKKSVSSGPGLGSRGVGGSQRIVGSTTVAGLSKDLKWAAHGGPETDDDGV